MTNYNDGNWHGWNGGECPVHPKSRVDIAGSWGITRNKLAGDVSWNGGVIAFRIVKEHREPREWWLIPGGSFTGRWAIYDHNPGRIDAIYVREALE